MIEDGTRSTLEWPAGARSGNRVGTDPCRDRSAWAIHVSSWHAALDGRTLAVSAGLFLLACLTVLFFQMAYPVPELIQGTDYDAFYEPVARRLVDGHGLVFADGTPATRYPPGYPIVVAAILAVAAHWDLSATAVFRAAAMLCVGLVAVFLHLVARTVWAPVPAIGAALIWMTYPGVLWLTMQRSSELSFAVFLYASVAAFWFAGRHSRRAGQFAFAAGMLAGAAMLTRPIAIGLGVLLAVRLLTRSDNSPAYRRWRLAGLTLLGTCLVVLPWVLWVHARTGQVIPLSTGGPASARDGLTYAVSAKGFRQGAAVPDDVAEVMKNVRAQYASLRSAGAIAGVLAEELRERPIAVGKLFLIKAARSWYATDAQRLESSVLLLHTVYLAVIAWATWAAWRSGPLARRLVVDVWVLVIYFWAMTTLTLSIARYMVPAMGLLFLLVPAVLHRPRAWTAEAS